MKNNILIKCLLVGVVSSVGALADMTVEKSVEMLTLTSTIDGTVVAKIVGPDDKVIVNEKYEGNTFSWTPSGADGAYRYDVRVIPKATDIVPVEGEEEISEVDTSIKSDYAGGSVEVTDGQMITKEEE
ncbi:MAG: Unknown protein [uncultured Sulfurovum sp.]|uniref:Uncharacterized protein n=1 Tax=uncultured Sulfurovum sp. TaxID=269237 RepID=A0A6S6T3A7_9BACT|nr:MAG: Unknown protein [uncultured Sulfurovum sp.]